jgi:tetratricopeptide (TPR) repeat protein
MKRIVPSPGLCFSISLVIFYLSFAQLSFAQDCKMQAENKPSAYDANFQNFMNPVGKPASWDISKMKPRLAKVEGWMRTLLKGFTGAKLMYGNYYFLDPLRADIFYRTSGLESSYEGIMMFFAYYCYENNNKIFTEAESGSNIKVDFNNVFSSGVTTDTGVYTINGKPAFRIIQKKRSEGRIDFYEQRVQDNATAKMYTANDYIILRNSDKPVFIAFTRKEYLEQMLKDVENFGPGDTKSMSEIYAQNAKQFEAEMKAYKLDKNYTAEKEAKRRKWFEEDQEKLKKVIGKINPDAEAAKAVILQYLKKPAEWLKRNFNNFYPYSTYTAKDVTQYLESLDRSLLSNEEETQNEIVSINPVYFNNKLGVDVPQLITIRLQNGSYDHMLKVNKLVMQPGAFTPLEAMLNGNSSSSPATSPAIVSNYKVAYLSKLDKLTPLTVPPDMKTSAVPVIPDYNIASTATTSFAIPPLSSKLAALQQNLNPESYKAYIQQLYTGISNAIKPQEKKNAEEYLSNKKISRPNDISNTAFAVWLQNAPAASLYLYSKALTADPFNALAANNFSACLIMGGLSEKSVPILEYWNKQKPHEPNLLCNLGNAYFRLGDIDKAIKYLQDCVQYDSLNPTANKILCLLYLKKGDTKKAGEHGTRSLTGSHDEQVIAILRQLNNKTKPGEIMSRLPVKEFPMLQRIKLPAMPVGLQDMEQFAIELEAEKRSLDMTIENIDSKTPKINDDLQQKMLMQSFTKGMSPIRVKAQAIIMDGMQTYQNNKVKEAEVFKHNWEKLVAPFSIKTKAIMNKYAVLLNKLEGGEAGDEDQIQALELARCKEINAEKEKYLAGLSPLVNGYAQRQEFISRKFYRDYANWAPYWMPETSISFASIERDYLKDITGILSEYKLISKSDCSVFEAPPKKEGVLQQWEDEYCANFKGKIGMGAAKISWTCNSWMVEGGEGLVGELGMNYSDDGELDNFTIGAGVGETWSIGNNGANAEANASFKDFIKIGKDQSSGKWIVKDFGIKAGVSAEANLGPKNVEVTILEVSAAVNAGISLSSEVPPLLHLN